ncbi:MULTISPECIES: DUF4244 domain-containing protein [unclassified Actinomyces]|uniref:DUF4244 domain-containing protein n=1 Tax=unclassified Actinomyces TaxID=2609248 RepID=UPI002016B3A7|nr:MULTISPECIES: DUF4244 domain-containing protein [unclassified Actinomyces]MCL3777237.1 DUF4244 domain-containing protein [Actinomyces sp. AC-20-1]MCL3790369.1 DUF4244 domain-containing protein [Actinomyces sp. 187325]MCL3792678.1 DUF4244 domain-containing protein [Actinomyces sp. 186855]MCL3795166.1 DUF4244 domain-containing protein [Actinomyces sp. 217892]
MPTTTHATHSRRFLDAVRTSWLLAHPADGGRTAPDGSSDPGQEAGMATAEYAIGTLAAAAFGGLLLAVIRSGSIGGLIQSLIESALSIG